MGFLSENVPLCSVLYIHRQSMSIYPTIKSLEIRHFNFFFLQSLFSNITQEFCFENFGVAMNKWLLSLRIQIFTSKFEGPTFIKIHFGSRKMSHPHKTRTTLFYNSWLVVFWGEGTTFSFPIALSHHRIVDFYVKTSWQQW